jgi:hypothetical protein
VGLLKGPVPWRLLQAVRQFRLRSPWRKKRRRSKAEIAFFQSMEPEKGKVFYPSPFFYLST